MINLQETEDRLVEALTPLVEKYYQTGSEDINARLESNNIIGQTNIEIERILGTVPDHTASSTILLPNYKKTIRRDDLPNSVGVIDYINMYYALGRKCYGVTWAYVNPDTYELIGHMFSSRELLKRKIKQLVQDGKGRLSRSTSSDLTLDDCVEGDDLLGRVNVIKFFLNLIPSMTIQHHSIFAHSGTYAPSTWSNVFNDNLDNIFGILCGCTDTIIVEINKVKPIKDYISKHLSTGVVSSIVESKSLNSSIIPDRVFV